MSKGVDSYTYGIVQALKGVAKDNAVREGSNDEGFKVRITKDDVRNGTERKRIKSPVMENVTGALNSSGLEAHLHDDYIDVFVPPVLGKKDIFTLDEILERKKVVDEINENTEMNIIKSQMDNY